MEPHAPAVTCTSCQRSWNSASMAEGLRLLGACPRCNGALSFAADSGPESTMSRISPETAVSMAPHLVMGIPRR
ncbi:MAG: hypothetical protein QOG68_1851 [Solirubrobacteraceae bacterium]|nr:hypothetical protein [Solirubrobacteraceae bacterium]